MCRVLLLLVCQAAHKATQHLTRDQPWSDLWKHTTQHMLCMGSGVYWHLPELQRSEAQSAWIHGFLYSGWSCAEGPASEESGKESCVIELAIVGSIDIGKITQHTGERTGVILPLQLKKKPLSSVGTLHKQYLPTQSNEDNFCWFELWWMLCHLQNVTLVLSASYHRKCGANGFAKTGCCVPWKVKYCLFALKVITVENIKNLHLFNTISTVVLWLSHFNQFWQCVWYLSIEPFNTYGWVLCKREENDRIRSWRQIVLCFWARCSPKLVSKV